MSNIISLTRVILKETLASLVVSKKKIWNVLFLLFLLIAAVVPLFFVFTYLFENIIKLLHQVQQTGIIINLMLFLITLVILLFSLLHIPSVYYFSKDTESFLTLPVKPSEILTSKFIVILLFEYIIVAIVMIPFMIMHQQITGLWGSTIISIVVAILVPIIPIILSSIIMILLLNYVPFLRNKNTLMLIIGLIAIALSVGIQFLQPMFQNISQQEILALINEGHNSISKVIFGFFPSILFAGNAIANQSVIDLLIFIAITFGLFLVYIFVGENLYLNGVTAISESNKSKKKFSKDLLNQAESSSVKLAFFKRELKSIFRVPAYLLNVVLPVLLFPVLIIVIPFLKTNTLLLEDGINISQVIQTFLASPENTLFFGTLAAISLSFMMGMSSNILSATTVSREKNELSMLKTFPINYLDMFIGKMGVGLLLQGFSILVFLVVASFLLKIPLTTLLIVGFVSLLFSIMTNLLLIMVDLNKPNLKWSNETQVIKQGMNVMIASFGTMIISALFGGLAYLLRNSKIMYFVVTIILLLCGIGLALFYLNNNAQKKLLEIEV